MGYSEGMKMATIWRRKGRH